MIQSNETSTEFLFFSPLLHLCKFLIFNHFFSITFSLLVFVETGIIKYLMNENLTYADICPLNLGGTERQLRNSDLAMTYELMFVGLAVSAVIFFSEVNFLILLSATMLSVFLTL